MGLHACICYSFPVFALFPSRSVAFEFFGFGVHWYGLLYLAAFVLGYFLLPRLQKHRGLMLSNDEWASILSWIIAGVIAGGRLGYVLLYEPVYFATHLWKIPAVWEGGMSFHGGLIGVMIALIFVSRTKKISFLALADVFMVPVAIGLALGRLGNFINQELYGIPTSLLWGIAIPGVEGLRHPTQIYAMMKDLMIASICFFHLRATAPRKAGETSALFLMLYGLGRTLVEFVREPTHAPLVLGSLTITRGQLLSIPMFIAGVIAWYVLVRRPKNVVNP